jgi:NADPH:quinone reductase-like Zn-dependent oxidoreductase
VLCRSPRFGGPKVLEILGVPEPTPGKGQTLYDVSTAGINYADTHHRTSRNTPLSTPA